MNVVKQPPQGCYVVYKSALRFATFVINLRKKYYNFTTHTCWQIIDRLWSVSKTAETDSSRPRPQVPSPSWRPRPQNSGFERSRDQDWSFEVYIMYMSAWKERLLDSL